MRSSAAHYQNLCAMYGRRADITEFPTFMVLLEMVAATDEKRLQDWITHHIQKAASR